MWYTDFGVRHSPMLWKITRDCLGSVLVVLADSMDNVIEGKEDNDGEGHKYDDDNGDNDDNDGYEECEEVISNGELDEGAMEDIELKFHHLRVIHIIQIFW
jgi:hypothetical protein